MVEVQKNWGLIVKKARLPQKADLKAMGHGDDDDDWKLDVWKWLASPLKNSDEYKFSVFQTCINLKIVDR